MPRPARGRLAIAALAFSLLIALNIVFVGAWFGAWSPPPIDTGVWIVLAVILLVGGLAIASDPRARHGPTGGVRALIIPAGGGAAYGCFSALWHCCPPVWGQSALGAIDLNLWFLALAVAAGAIGWLGAGFAFGRGEIGGAVLFALVYPWHTPLFFVQCLLAGLVATQIARIFQTPLAPAAFLGAAYLTHTTLPFFGWWGAALAAIALAIVSFAQLPVRNARSRAARGDRREP
ncbi:MAG: hypothetical protein M3Y87_12900 [Myxococcota bacterium]|nr:hypothetical protein [Myxococcota bacterium]